ncbi:MAG: Protein RecA [Anaerolineae bacterium]|nr:Protein RecA [Anaerolineae bacterium]
MSNKRKRLEAAVAAIRQRWGQGAVRRGLPPSATTAIPTGFAALDAVLDGCGGIPRARLTELLGAPTSGMTTIALKVMAQAQHLGDTAAYLDLTHTFDPDYAARCEVNLNRLLLVRPHHGVEALAITDQLLRQRSAGFIVVEPLLDQPLPPAALSQLSGPLAQSAAALLFLTPLRWGGAWSTANYPPGLPLPQLASLRLELKKERWLERGRDVRGYEAKVLVLKNKLGRAGQQATIAITFNGTVRGDAT